MTDWESVARKRLRRIRELEKWQEAVCLKIYDGLRSELYTQLRIRRVVNSEELSITIARIVSEKATDL